MKLRNVDTGANNMAASIKLTIVGRVAVGLRRTNKPNERSKFWFDRTRVNVNREIPIWTRPVVRSTST